MKDKLSKKDLQRRQKFIEEKEVLEARDAELANAVEELKNQNAVLAGAWGMWREYMNDKYKLSEDDKILPNGEVEKVERKVAQDESSVEEKI